MAKLIHTGSFVLNSGRKSDFKLIADDFIAENLDGLAYLISKIAAPFSTVEGVPQGGCMLADAMRQYTTPDTETHLIVDDVLTTGDSMRRLVATHTTKRCIGAVVFARGACPRWIRPLFQLPPELFLKG